MTLEVVAATKEIDEKRKTFFNLLFGKARGLMCIAFKEQTGVGLSELFFIYPDQLDVALEEINRHIIDSNVYFCPQLFRERKRVKELVETTPNVWADLDNCPPNLLLVEPSLVLESSPDRYQGFWVLDDNYDPDDVENVAKRIAYKHAQDGADRSGWDLTQLLRIPYTYNYKYADPTIVKPINANRNQYSLKDFDANYPSVDSYLKIDAPLPSQPPQGVADDILQEKRIGINPQIWKLYSELPEEGKWSQALWKLMLLLFENGFTKDQVYVICTESACNKYARDGRPAQQLWKDICRAELKHSLRDKIAFMGDDVVNQIDLMTEQERTEVEKAGESFVERYITWASSLGDAAPQYHQAGAFVALATFLCGSVKLPTSFGTIYPNLWFMILGETTLSRKTTSMDIAIDLIEEINDDTILATDGSIEGMMTSLSLRSDKPSIFLRDEFSGLLEQMVKKDYMAGMAEQLTKLYDGKMQKRILRKEVIEVKNPRLIIFAGGIKNAVTTVLTTEHIASGFIPRFLFITSENDITRIKPVGPPVEKNLAGREKLLTELMKIDQWYNRVEETYLKSIDEVLTQKKFFEAKLTDEAWIRYNELELKLVEYGYKDSGARETMTPVCDRLAKSILKAAVLLAASRQFGEDVTVTKTDLLRAIKYGETWFTHTRAVVSRIGLGASERQLDSIVDRIRISNDGVSRSSLMRTYRLTAKDCNAIVQTLEQRGLIVRTAVANGERLRATSS